MIWNVNKQLFSSIKEGEIHIWQSSLQQTTKKIFELKNNLNNSELLRLSTYKSKDLQLKSIVSRGILKKLISSYLQIDPKDYLIKENLYGKPYLDFSPLKFNISHSNNMIIYIFTLDSQVGIDIEYINKNCEFINIAKKIFTNNEFQQLISLPKFQQLYAFFSCWTCKEAFVKYLGKSLFVCAKKISIDIDKLVWNHFNKESFLYNKLIYKKLTLMTFNLHPNYVGSFVFNNKSYYNEKIPYIKWLLI